MRRAIAGFVAIELALVGTAVFAPPVRAAPQPSAWCGDETSVDRPDVVAGDQIHVVYAFPADAPDNFARWATPIARDLAADDEWWQGQDPTRTLRFDLASFPGCTTEFGQLDISSFRLPGTTADYRGLDPSDLLNRLSRDLAGSYQNAFKKYLVYFDGPSDSADVCGISVTGPTGRGSAGASSLVLLQPESGGCTVAGGFGATGGGWTAHTAVHEIIHSLNAPFTPGTAPHACPNDTGHVCDNPNDIMDPGGNPLASPRLRDSILDAGHDDYYDHPGTWWDVRNSPFLVHLDAPQFPLAIVVARGQGVVLSAQPGALCTDQCVVNWDSGTQVTLNAMPAQGFGFVGWDGECSGTVPSCTVTMDSARSVSAYFGAVDAARVVVRGKGTVSSSSAVCTERCSWPSVDGQSMLVTATARKGWRFAGWRGACQGPERTCALVTRPRTVLTARFVER
jgi:hypothetical protein